MTPEIHDVVIWSRGLDRADEILADLRTTFRLLDVVHVEWSAERFGDCLTRFYEDSTMGSGSSKEQHIGTGPFLVAVVEDAEPVYERRTTSRGKAVVHAGMFDAKARYRELMGGGHLVHGSVSALEGDRDLYFLIGERSSSFLGNDAWDGTVHKLVQDVLGVEGWRDRQELLVDLELSLPYVVLDDGPPLTVLIEERWWADVVAVVHRLDRRARRLAFPVGGAPFELVVSHVGDGSVARRRQGALLRGRVRDENGTFVPRQDLRTDAARAAEIARRGAPGRWQRLASALR